MTFGWSSEPACVTAVAGATLSDALAVFSVEPFVPVARGDAAFDSFSMVVIAEHDHGVVVWEDNGYYGSLSNELAALSAHGRAASAFWNVNAVTAVAIAENGVVLGDSEAGYPTEVGADPERLNALLRAAAPEPAALDGFVLDDIITTMLTVVASFTGLPVDAAQFARVAVGYVSVAQPSPVHHRFPLDVARLRFEVSDENFGLGDPRLGELLAACSAAERQQFAQRCVQTALAENDLQADPDLQDALARGPQLEAAHFSAAATRVIRSLAAEAQALDTLHNRRGPLLAAARRRHAAAWSVFLLCVGSDPEWRVIDAAKRARHAHPQGLIAWADRARSWLPSVPESAVEWRTVEDRAPRIAATLRASLDTFAYTYRLSASPDAGIPAVDVSPLIIDGQLVVGTSGWQSRLSIHLGDEPPCSLLVEALESDETGDGVARMVFACEAYRLRDGAAENLYRTNAAERPQAGAHTSFTVVLRLLVTAAALTETIDGRVHEVTWQA